MSESLLMLVEELGAQIKTLHAALTEREEDMVALLRQIEKLPASSEQRDAVVMACKLRHALLEMRLSA